MTDKEARPALRGAQRGLLFETAWCTDVEWLEKIFGVGKDLDVLQMSARAVVVFGLTLVAVRIAGRRAFGQRTPFDFVVAILLGAISSRAVVGASPFVPTMAAAFVIVILHRVLALISVASPLFDAWVNGHERVILRDGRPDREQLRKGLITDRDLDECMRLHGKEGVAQAHKMVLERSGEISVLEKDSGS